MYFSKNILGVNPVVMNYKITHEQNRPATRPVRHSLAWPDCLFCYYLWWQKMEKHSLDMGSYMQGSHGGRLAQCVS